jgi:hypothetical protein
MLFRSVLQHARRRHSHAHLLRLLSHGRRDLHRILQRLEPMLGRLTQAPRRGHLVNHHLLLVLLSLLGRL